MYQRNASAAWIHEERLVNAALMGCRVLEEPGVFPVLLWLQSDENQRYLMSHFLFMAPTRSRFPLQGPPLLPSVIPQTIEQVSAYGSMLLCPPPPNPPTPPSWSACTHIWSPRCGCGLIAPILIKQNMFRAEFKETLLKAGL